MKSRLISIAQGDQLAWIYPEHGFQLFDYEQKIRGKKISVVYAPNLDHEPADRRYGNPILFPPSGSCSKHGSDTWVWNGKVLPMPGHGLARNSYWHVVEVKSDSITAEFIPNSSATICFPFEFKMLATYRLDSRGLVLDLSLVNTGKHAFPYALGFHPYLRTPLGEQGKIGDCSVSLGKGVRLTSSDLWMSIQQNPPEKSFSF